MNNYLLRLCPFHVSQLYSFARDLSNRNIVQPKFGLLLLNPFLIGHLFKFYKVANIYWNSISLEWVSLRGEVLSVKLDVIGSAGSYPSPNAACSSYLVSSKGTSILLDAGNGSLSRLFRSIDPSELDAIVISHSHLDHFADLVGIYHYLKFARPPKLPISIYGTPDFRAKFRYLVGEEVENDGVFSIVTGKRGQSIDVDSIKLTFFEGNHSVPTLITKVSDGISSLCYGADGDSCKDLSEASANVDLLLGEATWVGAGLRCIPKVSIWMPRLSRCSLEIQMLPTL